VLSVLCAKGPVSGAFHQTGDKQADIAVIIDNENGFAVRIRSHSRLLFGGRKGNMPFETTCRYE
jgi:hypothetical protein